MELLFQGYLVLTRAEIASMFGLPGILYQIGYFSQKIVKLTQNDRMLWVSGSFTSSNDR